MTNLYSKTMRAAMFALLLAGAATRIRRRVDTMNLTTHSRKSTNFFANLISSALLALMIGSYPGVANCKTIDPKGQGITIEDGMVLIDVMVNGNGPFRMVVDTGAASCVLKPEAAKNAGLTYDHRTVLATLKGESVVLAASDNIIQVGERSEPHVDVIVTEIPQFRAIHSRADGVLGQSYLARMPFLIDYGQRRMLVGPEATRESERLPVAIVAGGKTGRLVVPVVLEPGGRAWRLTLDSGASNTVVECSENCPRTIRAAAPERLLTYGGEQSVSKGTFKRATLQGAAMPRIEAVIVNVTSPDGQDEGVLPTRLFSAVYVDNRTVKLAATQ